MIRSSVNKESSRNKEESKTKKNVYQSSIEQKEARRLQKKLLTPFIPVDRLNSKELLNQMKYTKEQQNKWKRDCQMAELII